MEAWGSVHKTLEVLHSVQLDDYISLFVPFFYISVSINNLFQRIASVDHGF